MGVVRIGRGSHPGKPEGSYLWQFVDGEGAPQHSQDLAFDQCMFGAACRKPTVLRCWGWFPSELAKRCAKTSAGLACGNSEHVRLEFGGGSTAAAAEYPKGLCTAWADAVANELAVRLADQSARTTARPQDSGRVLRHSFRGSSEASRKEAKTLEDEAAWSGTRNPMEAASLLAWLVARAGPSR